MADKKINKKITLEDLTLRKLSGNLDKLQIKTYYSKELGGDIQIKKIPIKKYMGMLNGVNEDDMLENIDFMNTAIFESCPIFKENSKSLMETYEVSIPTDLPLVVLNENMNELTDIIEIINGFYGLDKVKEQIKN